MFERFTESARQVIVQAQSEARALKHGYIGTEHILLGLLLEGEGVAAWTLAKFDVTVDSVRREVAATVEPQDPGTEQMPFSPRAKQLLERALREALSLGHNYIGTEHVLLAVLAEEDSAGARILREFAQPEAIRTEVLRRLGEERRKGPPRDFPAMPFRRVPGSMASAAGEWDVDFAELASLSDEDLDELIDRLGDDEKRLLYKQGALQGQLEILRAQRNHRRRRQAGGDSSRGLSSAHTQPDRRRSRPDPSRDVVACRDAEVHDAAGTQAGDLQPERRADARHVERALPATQRSRACEVARAADRPRGALDEVAARRRKPRAVGAGRTKRQLRCASAEGPCGQPVHAAGGATVTFVARGAPGEPPACSPGASRPRGGSPAVGAPCAARR